MGNSLSQYVMNPGDPIYDYLANRVVAIVKERQVIHGSFYRFYTIGNLLNESDSANRDMIIHYYGQVGKLTIWQIGKQVTTQDLREAGDWVEVIGLTEDEERAKAIRMVLNDPVVGHYINGRQSVDGGYLRGILENVADHYSKMARLSTI